MKYLPFLLPLMLWSGCNSPKPSSKPVGKPVPIAAPLGLPPLPVPPDNPATAESIALGEKLFFSPLLSVDRTLSCGDCHNPKKSFADGQRVSTGVRGRKGQRNAPSVHNAAYNALQFWDGRAQSLEDQASGPMMNSVEMAHTAEGVEQRLGEDQSIRDMFVKAFGPAPNGRSPITMARVTHAIASYERTLLRANSPFDHFYFGGDQKALNPEAQRGLAVFRDPAKGNCATCHRIEAKYALFTDNKFHNLGVGVNPEGELTDLGRYEITKRDGDQGAFRTPSLRNVAETAPYMHDGSLKTLKEVVDFYVGGGNANPYRDKEIRPLTHLTRQERSDLIAFLESLTGGTGQ
jgi:cytochrome c peroxidase